jgi:hypothetical protein
MQITNEELGKHYASLSDGELEDIDPAELTDVARKVYELEVKKRHLAVRAAQQPEEEDGPEPAVGLAEIEDEDEPEWLDSAECVCSFADAQRAKLAQDYLLGSGVPCHVTIAAANPSADEYQVMIPSGLHLRAKSVLDIQLFNDIDETGVRAHLEGLSDEEFEALKPDDIYGGVRDMLERLTRVYEEESARRSG